MPWIPPPSPRWLDRLNAHGAAVGGAEYLVSLEPDDLLAAARRSTGLHDFGGDTWRPHFDVLVAALRTEARLTVAGRVVARTELLRVLRQRLLLTATWAADPTILDEEIDAPVFVVGTGRSGTSILHELLALDPDQPDARAPGSCSSPPRHRAATRRRRAALGHDVHAFWADLAACLRRRCTTTTATSRTSASSSRCWSSSPTSGEAPTRCRPTRRTSCAPTRPRPTGTTARCCRRCNAASARRGGC